MCSFFNSYEESLHLGMRKLAKYVRNCVVFWKKLHSWQKLYTTAGFGGRVKFQFCKQQSLVGLCLCKCCENLFQVQMWFQGLLESNKERLRLQRVRLFYLL